MSTMTVSDQRRRSVRFPRASLTWSLIAAALFLGSAALQVAASLQRWVTFRLSRQPNEYWGEDHVFDYTVPYNSPPYAAQPAILWEPVGTAAQVYGIGLLIQAVGVLAVTFGVLALRGRAARRRRVLVEIVLAVTVTAAVGLTGTHALLSGIAGTPSPLQQHYRVLDLGVVTGLIALAVLWRTTSIAAAVACAFLLGSSSLGHLLAGSFASGFAGYMSHDTTPWTETVIAAWIAGAGVAMLAGIWSSFHRGRPLRSAPTS